MYIPRPGIAVVTRKTRLQGLLAPWVTKGQAKFKLRQAHLQERARHTQSITATAVEEADDEFDDLADEDSDYQEAVAHLQRELNFGLPIQLVDREFLPNFDFQRFKVVVVVGQDGLVANAAKYVGSIPIVAVNPDPERIDGVLLPYRLKDARRAVGRVLEDSYRTRDVTLAEVTLPDGQRQLAFNDFYIGSASHVSARYSLRSDGDEEPQSSSGILVTTGAGSTGWFSSVFNMVEGISRWRGADPPPRLSMNWEDRFLLWSVREPFVSKTSRANLVAGQIREGEELVVESLMSSGGVIFSDGIESDYLEFNSGTIARLAVSRQRARLVSDTGQR